MNRDVVSSLRITDQQVRAADRQRDGRAAAAPSWRIVGQWGGVVMNRDVVSSLRITDQQVRAADRQRDGAADLLETPLAMARARKSSIDLHGYRVATVLARLDVAADMANVLAADLLETPLAMARARKSSIDLHGYRVATVLARLGARPRRRRRRGSCFQGRRERPVSLLELERAGRGSVDEPDLHPCGARPRRRRRRGSCFQGRRERPVSLLELERAGRGRHRTPITGQQRVGGVLPRERGGVPCRRPAHHPSPPRRWRSALYSPSHADNWPTARRWCSPTRTWRRAVPPPGSSPVSRIPHCANVRCVWQSWRPQGRQLVARRRRRAGAAGLMQDQDGAVADTALRQCSLRLAELAPPGQTAGSAPPSPGWRQ